MSFLRWFKRAVLRIESITVRARDDKGRYIKDDPATTDVNEAYTTKDVKIEPERQASGIGHDANGSPTTEMPKSNN